MIMTKAMTKESITTALWSLLRILVAVAAMVTAATATAATTTELDHLLDDLGWDGQIGQMAQIDVNMLLTNDKNGLDQEKLDHFIGKLGVGSVLNNIVADGSNEQQRMWKISDFRNAVVQIQQTAQRYGRPPVIWGLDSVHGANYLYDTLMAPQPINIAASFNTTIAYQAGKWASHDTRRAGIPWLFSPLLGLSWNPFWSRVYETFGEDPLVVGDMARAMVQGIQEKDENSNDKKIMIPSKAAACGKHWVGYSFPHNGHDRAPSWIPTRHLYQYFLLPWKRVLPGRQGSVATRDGNQGKDNDNVDVVLDTVMESYTEIDGVPNAANRRTLSRMLRMELGFEGMLVTDYHEIFNLYEWHHTASDRADALRQAMVEGTVDMSMIANEPDDFFDGMNRLNDGNSGSGNGSGDADRLRDRVRESARRILQLKLNLGMFEESFQMSPEDPQPNHQLDNGTTTTTSIPQADLQAALEVTHQSIVMTKNENVLPLPPGKSSEDPLKILITGPTSTSLSFQTGGWTWQWQGVDSRKEKDWFTYGSTVYDAMKESEVELNWRVSYECGVDILGDDCTGVGQSLDYPQKEPQGGSGFVDTVKDWVGWSDQNYSGIQNAVKAAKEMDAIVVCLGEENYTEKPGDIRDLALPKGQYELVTALREAAPDTKIILLFFGGRPRLLADVVPAVDAVFVAFLPGPLGGDALVDLISGKVNPSARLPVTYPMYEDLGGVPYLHAVSDMCTADTGGTLPHWENVPCEVQWGFGHGLSYSEFQYSDLELNTETLQQGQEDALVVSVNVKNIGSISGAHTILFFTFDEFRATTPEYKRLRAYEKIWLEPGSSTQVTVSIPLEDLRFVGPHDDHHYILQDGLVFRVGIGSDADCRREPGSNLCSTPISIQTEKGYVGACEAACSLWEESGCPAMSDVTCKRECSGIHQSTATSLNNDGWGWAYVSCVESIVWDASFDPTEDCRKLTSLCRDVLSTSGVDEYGAGHGSNNFAKTGIQPWALSLALFSGIFASVMIVCAMNGGCTTDKAVQGGDVQFTAISTAEVEHA